MNKHIIEAYHSSDEAVAAVNTLELKGHQAKSIMIITNRDNTNNLKSQTDVNVQSSSLTNENKSSFMDNIKKLFTHDTDFNLGIYETLVDFGLTSEQATRCINDVETGMFLVIADDNIRMGHTPLADL